MGILTASAGQAQKPIVYSGLQVSSSMMDLPVTLFWGQRRMGTNAIDCENFVRHDVSAGGKGGGGKGGKTYDYTGAVILGLCEGPIDSIANVWAAGSSTTTTTLSALNMSLFLGTSSQTPWSYMTTNYPAKARAYAYTAYLACPNLDLGSGATIPDNAFECVRSAGFAYVVTSNGYKDPTTGAVTTAIDVLLSDCAHDLLTNPQYGMQMSSPDVGDLTQYATYLRAQGLVCSPLLKSQEKCTSVMDRWAQLSNAWIYWSGTQLQFVPLGDSAITANGVTYTPDTTPAYNLSLANGDFLDSAEPVKVSRKDPADCYNKTTIQICDRVAGYVTFPIEYKDQTLVDQFGIRDNSSVQADEICNPDVGNIVANLIGKRAAYIRKTYSFKTGFRYLRMLPGTIITLTEPNAALYLEPVRVKTINEDENCVLSVECEEFPGIIGTYLSSGGNPTAGTTSFPNQYVDPGDINTPAVCEPSSDLTNGVATLVVATSGASKWWGGCTVYVSFDAADYKVIGTITAPAIQGLLTAGLAAGSDPDTVHTLAVDTTESNLALSPATHADADAGRTLVLVSAQPTPSGGAEVLPINGELLSYGAVSTTSTYGAALTYLRRGRNGTTSTAHSIGDQFTVIDTTDTLGTTIFYALPAEYIGQPIYLKFTSFNIFAKGEQDLSTAVEFVYAPAGTGFGLGTAGVPKLPTGLVAVSSSGKDDISWNANVATDNVTTYRLWAAPGPGGLPGSASVIFQGLATHYSRTLAQAGTTATYFVEALNVVGSSGLTAGVDAVYQQILSSYGVDLVLTTPANGELYSPPSDSPSWNLGAGAGRINQGRKVFWTQSASGITSTSNIDFSLNCSVQPTTSAVNATYVGVDYLASSANLFTLAGITNGQIMNPDGSTTANATYSYSDYIAVVAGQTYTANQTMHAWCYFDGGQNVVAGGSSTPGTTFTVPTGVSYVRVTVTTSSDASFTLAGPLWTPVPGAMRCESTQSLDPGIRSSVALSMTVSVTVMTNIIIGSQSAFRSWISPQGHDVYLHGGFFKANLAKAV